jgi:hypothetical protein
MAMEFAVNFNMGNAVSSLLKVNNISKDIQKQFDKMSVTAKGMNYEFTSITKATDDFSNTAVEAGKNTEKLVKTTKKIRENIVDANAAMGSFEELVNGTSGFFANLAGKIPVVGDMLSKLFSHPVKNVFDLNKKMASFNDAFAAVNKTGGGFENMMGNLFTNFAGNLKSFTANISNVGALLTKGLLPAISAGFHAIIPAVIGLGTALLPIIGTVLAIAAVVYTLKKIWDLNIGGIQTSVFQLAGMFKDTLGKSALKFQQILQKLSPIFKLVFQPLFQQLKIIWAIFSGLIDIVFAVIDPIAEALGELAAPFADLQGEGMGLIDVVKWIGKYFSLVTKGIGISMKIILFPIKLIALGIKTIIDLVKVLWERFKQSPIFAKMMEVMADRFNKVKGVVEKLIEPFKWLLDASQKIGKFLGIIEEEEGGAAGGKGAGAKRARTPGSTMVSSSSQRTTNVSPNITINTSREISGAGAKQFSSELSTMIETQAKGA